MIVVTGAAGFIGSCLVGRLNQEGFKDIVAVDDFSNPVKDSNLDNKILTTKVDRKDFFSWLEANHKMVQFVYHIGARTDTAEFDVDVFNALNLNYSKFVWRLCCEFGLPLVYASSAATYGSGELGYNDDHDLVPKLIPLNPYGESKNEFDKWVLNNPFKPYFWTGLKFFNVYGPNEYHKGRMASVVYHASQQIISSGRVKLFRSHRPDFGDGMQKRDFIYVKDVIDVLYFLLHNRRKEHSAIYNLGTGHAETFLNLVSSLFEAMNKPADIEFIDIPGDIRDKYQYFTEAKMDKLRKAGYDAAFTSLSDGVKDYALNYLPGKKKY